MDNSQNKQPDTTPASPMPQEEILPPSPAGPYMSAEANTPKLGTDWVAPVNNSPPASEAQNAAIEPAEANTVTASDVNAITPEKKGSGKTGWKMFASLAVVIVLMGGVAVGVVLVGKEQIFQQKAAAPPTLQQPTVASPPLGNYCDSGSGCCGADTANGCRVEVHICTNKGMNEECTSDTPQIVQGEYCIGENFCGLTTLRVVCDSGPTGISLNRTGSTDTCAQ